MMIEAVIFDIGNVLISWQPERFYDSIMPVERRKALFAQVDLHEMNNIVDRGGPFKQTIYDMADANPDFRDEIRIWHDRWIEMAQPAIERSVELLRALRTKGVPVLALSNFGIDSFAYAATFYPFLGEFDQRYISGHMGVIKPDPKIYELLEAECGFAPQTLLFADDRDDNIAEATRRGWHGHLFTSATGWAECLVSYGLLSRAEAGLEG